MDIQKLDIKELKSLAYDQLRELQRVQTNINLIEARIAELEKEQHGDNESNTNDTRPTRTGDTK
jgi:hypothetical protein